MRPVPQPANILRAGLAFALLAASAACHRAPPKTVRGQPPTASPGPPQATGSPAEPAASLPEFADQPVSVREGNAVWYDVPADSLAQRRAGPNELTAASDALPLHSYARVTRDENGKSVIVHITDDGLHKAGAIIDLDRPAAETLEIIKAGKAHVKVEALALKHPDAAGTPAPPGSSTPAAR